MRLSFKKLKQLSVETASGIKLGHVSDITLDMEGQLVAQYIVKHSILSDKAYFINRDQIIRFENKKIIVDDNVKKIAEPAEKEKITVTPEPISMRKSA